MQQQFDVDAVSNLDLKLNDWLFIMRQQRMNQFGIIWNHFDDFRKLNNASFKHTSSGAQAVSFNEMVKHLNKFKTGVAGFLFKLHAIFNNPIPSKVIRGTHLPNVFI